MVAAGGCRRGAGRTCSGGVKCEPNQRQCEEQSDEAIQTPRPEWIASLHCARNDDAMAHQ